MKIFFIGRFPAEGEVGGVTTFTYNFAEKFKRHNLEILDLYPGKKKIVPQDVKYKVIEGNFFIRYLSLFKYAALKKSVYFFNFSGIHSAILFIFLPKAKNNRWFAIFHNGDQESIYKKYNFLMRFFIKLGVSRLDAVGAISCKQKKYLELIFSKKIYQVSPYIKKDIKRKEKRHVKKFDHTLRILVSGFPRKIYRIMETVDVIKRIDVLGKKIQLDICLYGIDHESFERTLNKNIEDTRNIFVHKHLGHSEFSALLKMTDIYIRMNSVDSFGLVVAEAIDFGCIVISTNVCERYQGSHLIGVDEFESLYCELQYLLNNGELSGQLRVQEVNNSHESYEDILLELSRS